MNVTWVAPLGVIHSEVCTLVGNLQTSICSVVGSHGVIVDGEVILPDTCMTDHTVSQQVTSETRAIACIQGVASVVPSSFNELDSSMAHA